jgi:uncharacterized membrane protein
MSRTIAIALVAFIAFVVELATGQKISAETQAELANSAVIIVAFVGTVWGIFKNHKKTEK